MKTSKQAITDAPKSPLRGLQKLRNQLTESLGDDLISIVVYGDFAKPAQFDLRSSSLDVMLVLKDVSTSVLDGATDPIVSCSLTNRVSALIVTENELISSCDVFPIKFLDMQQDHHLLWGKDVLQSLAISDEHLRLRCEQEMKNVMLRLRNLYLRRAKQPKLLHETLTVAITSVLKTLAACLTLKTGVAPTQNDAIIDAATEEFGLDGEVLKQILALKHEPRLSDLQNLRRLYSAFMTVVQRASEAIDKS